MLKHQAFNCAISTVAVLAPRTCVIEFAKSRLTGTQQQDTHFTITQWQYTFSNSLGSQVLALNGTQAAFDVTCFEACQTFTSALVVFRYQDER